MIYLDTATTVLFDEKTSSYSVTHGLDKAFEEKEERLRSLFKLGSEDRYCITSSWDDVPRTIVRSSGKKKFSVYLSDSKAVLGACDEVRGVRDVMYLRDGEKAEDSLLFLQYVHPLTGVVVDVREIEAAQTRGCLVALDVSYAWGKVPLDNVLERADYVMVRGSALGVPYGFSLVASRGHFLEPRETSFSVLKAFVESVEKVLSQELFFATEGVRLREIFEEGEEVLFRERERAPHISCMKFPGIKNELLLFTLSKRNVFATMGGGPFQLLDRTLPSMGVAPLDAMTALSFSFGSDTKETEIREAKVRLQRAVKELRVISEGLS